MLALSANEEALPCLIDSFGSCEPVHSTAENVTERNKTSDRQETDLGEGSFQSLQHVVANARGTDRSAAQLINVA